MRIPRWLLALLWIGFVLFPFEAWAQARPQVWRAFLRVLAVPGMQALLHVLLFAIAVVLVTPNPCPRRCRRWVFLGLLALAVVQEALQARFGPFRGLADAFRDLGLDLVGMALGAAFLAWRRTSTHDFHFDILVPQVYRLLHRRPPRGLARLREGLQPGMRVLDVGGGTGRVVQHLPPEVMAVVVDPSPGMLKAAPREAHWHRVRGLAEHLPFPDAAFHRVVIVDALHHFANQERGLKEVWRVLRPGGRVIIEEPDVEHPVGRWVPWFERALLMRSRFLPWHRIRDLFPEARLVALDTHFGFFRLVLEKPTPAEKRHA